MSKKVLLMMLLMAVFAPWAVNAQQALPYSYGFENNDLDAEGWTAQITSSSSGIYNAGTSTAHEGSYLFRFQYSEQNAYLVSPLLTGTDGGLDLSFFYKESSSTYGDEQFYVGYTTDESITDWSAFTYGNIVTASLSWQEYTSNLPAGTKRVAIKYVYNDALYLYLDDFTFEAPALCPKPTDLVATTTPGNGTEAFLAWTENGTATEWDIEYGRDVNFEEYQIANVSGTSSYLLEGLTPEVKYYARVKAFCGAAGYSTYSNVVSFTPTNAYQITVNEGTNTNGYIPVYGYYADQFSKSQFIIPAADLADMQYGIISKLTFYASQASVDWGAAEFEVYMTEVDYTTFETSTLVDWTSMEKVMNAGSLAISDNKMEVTFDAPYQYLGGNLMIGILQTTKGSYVTSTWNGVTQTGNTAIGGYETSKGLSMYMFLPKTTFDYEPGEAPACPKPTQLAVNYEEGTTATISWTSDATAWNIDVNGTVTAITENPYTLTGLELNTNYEVMVQASCGDATSEWAGPVSFATDFCMPENKCELTFVLTDSYGDGWNGNAIQVVDVESGRVLATMANQNLDGVNGVETQTIAFGLCEGREIQFVWVKGSYPGEASWIVMDVNGDEIFSGTGTTTMSTGDVIATYTMDCTITDCRRPTDLTVSEVGPHTAVLDWTENGGADAWVVEYTDVTGGGAVYTYDNVTKPYTLVGLFAETEYSVRVRPICSDFDDKWSKSVTFNTPVACPVPTDLEANNVTALSALISWYGFGESYDLRYMAVAGATPIGGGEEKAFTGNHNMQLKANPNARPNASTRANGLRDGWYYYDNGEYSNSIGTGGSDVYWAIMLPAGMTSETSLTKVSFYSMSGYEETITLSVYADGTDAPGTLLYTEEIEPEAADAFQEVTLATPVDVDPLQNLWIVLKQYGTYPAAGCVGPEDPNGRWISLDGETWDDVAGYGLDYTWMIRAYLEGEAVLPWIDVTGINGNEYEMTDLTPETTYVVQVRANCGDEGFGEWTSSIEFTTGSLCDAPYDLTASDITFTSVTLDWVNALESFNLKYRPIVHGEVLAEQNFDEGMGEWTTIDADEDGYDWVLGSECGGIYLAAGSSLAGHNSSADMIVSGSYSNVSGVGALTPDNYLVSPQVTLGGTISFWACGQDANYVAEHFGVAVSTTGNTDPADFTTIWETTMTAKGTGAKMNPGTTRSGNRAQGNWYQFTVDLSEYAGQEGYVAIRHFDCTDQFILDVDDIVIEGYVETPEWVEINETANPVVLTDLTYDTEYEWQVQGINAGCEGGATEWSEMATFFNPMPFQTIALSAGVNWFSTNIEITLNDLKAALVEALPGTVITIKSRTQTTNYNPSNGRWLGALSFNVNQMYKIVVTGDCEITLEGSPINPADHPVTISSGVNWIAFPLNVNMTPTDAFAGFAVNGDVVKSRTQTSNYTRGRWMGQLNTLEPGKGYIYKSSVAEDRILTFPSNAK